MKTLLGILILATLAMGQTLTPTQRTIRLDENNRALSDTDETVATRSVVANFSPRIKCWRMVWNDKDKLALLFESVGETGTINHLFLATTRETCEREAERLGLTILEDTVAWAGSREALIP